MSLDGRFEAEKRLLLICPTPWDRASLGCPDDPRARRGGWTASFPGGRYLMIPACEELFDTSSLVDGLFFDVLSYLRRLVTHAREAGIEGVLGTDDQPASLIAAYLASELGLPGPDPGTMLRLSHKVYSRELQRALVPEATPEFEAIDPQAPGRRARRLSFPFFTKPVKGTMSIRAQTVASEAELEAALHTPYLERLTVRAWLRSFQQLLDAHGLWQVPADFFIGESLLSGDQVTVDGFVEGGRVTIMGIVDSIMYPGTRSFQRFEYPSRLDAAAQGRLGDIVRRLIEGSGLDETCFNVEMFFDPARGTGQVIEVNPRMSYQFSDLYARVDGTSTYEIQLALATATPVRWAPRSGVDGAAASFVMRRFSDGKVERVPSAEEISRIVERFPGTAVRVLAEVGERLSEKAQDVGSFRYAIVNMAAPTREALYARYAEVEKRLVFEFSRGGSPMDEATRSR